MLLFYGFALKNIDHHLKLNISMYYPTILIPIRSDSDPTPHHIRHPKKSSSVTASVCNIRSAPHPTKNMDADVVKVLSDPI
jgi:hypothetical protein